MTKYASIFILLFLVGCANYGQLNLITELPEKLKENSGMVSYSGSSTWFIEDNGNSDNIYQTNFQGDFTKQFDVKNAKNVDWEDLTKDKEGNFYIGDFGNNDNKRKNLTILKLPSPEIEKGDKINAQTIKFSYPEQLKFPPKKNALLYDAEAFFHFKKYLYIFTKNRTSPFTGETLIYKVPDQPGNYEAELIGALSLCTDWDTCRITSAAISPDEKTIVLLSYGKLWTITEFSGDNFSKGKLKEIDLGIRTQLESVCFKDANTLLFSDEVRDNEGGNLYSYTLK